MFGTCQGHVLEVSRTSFRMCLKKAGDVNTVDSLAHTHISIYKNEAFGGGVSCSNFNTRQLNAPSFIEFMLS